jgi:hypothetical protein
MTQEAAKLLLQDDGTLLNVGDYADGDFSRREGDDLKGVAPATVGPLAGGWTELDTGSLVVADNTEVTVLAGESISPGAGEIPYFLAAPGTTPSIELQTCPGQVDGPLLLGSARFCAVSTVVPDTWDFRVRHREGGALKWAWYVGFGDISP